MAGPRNTSLDAAEFERKLEWFSKVDRPKPHVFDGLITALQLQEGFGLHTLNATARQRFEVNAQRNPGAVLHCFLEGSTGAELDGRPMQLGRNKGEPVKLVLTSIDEPQQFFRWSRPNEYVRKISIQMSHEWLDQNGLELQNTAATGGMKRAEWVASLDEIQALEKLASAPGFTSPVSRLQAEAATLGLVARCFGDLSNTNSCMDLSAREQAQLRRIEDFARQEGPLPSLHDLAMEGGLSQSSLRRLIQAVHGRSPLAHVRWIRLEAARVALADDRISVEDAAIMAGYASAANFATAFRRAFGAAPSQVRRRRPH